jgi:hypothetical protein
MMQRLQVSIALTVVQGRTQSPGVVAAVARADEVFRPLDQAAANQEQWGEACARRPTGSVAPHQRSW